MKGGTKSLLTSLTLGIGLAIALLAGVNHVAQADATPTHYVAPSGADSGDCANSLAPCASVQYALDQAGGGDLIKAAGGTYTGVFTRSSTDLTYSVTQMVFIDKDITIRGGYTTGDWSTSDPDANPTTLNAEGKGRVFYIPREGYAVVLEGLGIVNGQSPSEGSSAPHDGGGIYRAKYDSTGSLTLQDCDVMSNTSASDAGGIYVHGGALTIKTSRLVSNTATSTAGGLYARDATVTISNTLFQYNTGTSGSGGASIYKCDATVTGSTFRENTSGNTSGGLEASYGTLTLTDNEFLYNTADNYGGGFNIYPGEAGSVYTVTGNLIEGNVGAVDEDKGRGGGAYASVSSGGKLLFSDNQVKGNTALVCQDPTWYWAGFGGGLRVYVASDSTAIISNNLFQDNWGATGHQCVGRGGGVWVQGTATLEGNRIIDNRASQYPDWGGYLPVYGGGVYVYVHSAVTMTNNILAGNRYFDEDDNPFAPDYFSDGGAIHVGGQATPQNTQLYLYHNTIADNQSPAVFAESAGITMSHNIFAGQSTDIELERDRTGAGGSQPAALLGEYTLWYPSRDFVIVDGTADTSNDFVGDPDFTSDYHLDKDSAAIDRGPGVGVTNDIDGFTTRHEERNQVFCRLNQAKSPPFWHSGASQPPGKRKTWFLAHNVG